MKIEGPATRQKVDLLKENALRVFLMPGFGFSVAAIAYYFFFLNLEQEGGSYRVNALALAVYELLGLTYGTLLFGLLGGFLLCYGIYKWLRIKDFAAQIPREQEI